MPQIGNEQRPVILKNKNKGNRKLVRAGSRMTREERQNYNKGWDRIFGSKNQKDYIHKKT
jgi:hypothetical protein